MGDLAKEKMIRGKCGEFLGIMISRHQTYNCILCFCCCRRDADSFPGNLDFGKKKVRCVFLTRGEKLVLAARENMKVVACRPKERRCEVDIACMPVGKERNELLVASAEILPSVSVSSCKTEIDVIRRLGGAETNLSIEGIGIVGQGQSGVVFRARFGNDFVVCKRVLRGSKQVQEGCDFELRVLKMLSGRVGFPVLLKVVTFKCRPVLGSVRRSLTSQLRRQEINDYQSLFMSTVVGGKSRFMPLLDVAEVKRLFICLFTALETLHNLGICHNDVKHGNIVFNGASSEFLLIDFSHSFFISEKKCFGGTHFFAAPETVLRCKHLLGTKGDIYSAGVMLHGYLYLHCDDASSRRRRNCVGEHLRDVCGECFVKLKDSFEKELDGNIDCRAWFERPDCSKYSVSAFALLESCLSLDPLKRCSARDALDSNFLKVSFKEILLCKEIYFISTGRGGGWER